MVSELTGAVTSNDAEGLRRTVRDLLAITALPALWVGLAPEAVLGSLTEALHQILRGEWVYAVLWDGPGGCVRTAWGNGGQLDAAHLAGVLGPTIEQEGPHSLNDALGAGDLQVFVARLPLH